MGPVGPVAPVGPVGPGPPAGPVGPVGPGDPVKPVGPVGPGAPAGPVGPVGPLTPDDHVPSPLKNVVLDGVPVTGLAAMFVTVLISVPEVGSVREVFAVLVQVCV